MPATAKPDKTIGKLARATGLSIDTVRYYERAGLIGRVARSESGYRLYSTADEVRLRFIRQAKALGFSLADIAELLRLQDGEGQRSEVRQRAARRVAELDQKIRELSALRDALGSLVNRCSGKGSLRDCPIIEGVRAVALDTPSELSS